MPNKVAASVTIVSDAVHVLMVNLMEISCRKLLCLMSLDRQTKALPDLFACARTGARHVAEVVVHPLQEAAELHDLLVGEALLGHVAHTVGAFYDSFPDGNCLFRRLDAVTASVVGTG